jgi:hypothetical protein
MEALMRSFVRTAPLVAAVAVLVTGCQTPTHYYWGHYQDLIYASYAAPGKLTLKQEIALMESDLKKAQAEHKPVPPGFHAQLGYLFAKEGDVTAAKAQFQEEEREFPESTELMNRFIANMSGNNHATS